MYLKIIFLVNFFCFYWNKLLKMKSENVNTLNFVSHLAKFNLDIHLRYEGYPALLLLAKRIELTLHFHKFNDPSGTRLCEVV